MPPLCIPSCTPPLPPPPRDGVTSSGVGSQWNCTCSVEPLCCSTAGAVAAVAVLLLDARTALTESGMAVAAAATAAQARARVPWPRLQLLCNVCPSTPPPDPTRPSRESLRAIEAECDDDGVRATRPAAGDGNA